MKQQRLSIAGGGEQAIVDEAQMAPPVQGSDKDGVFIMEPERFEFFGVNVPPPQTGMPVRHSYERVVLVFLTLGPMTGNHTCGSQTSRRHLPAGVPHDSGREVVDLAV